MPERHPVRPRKYSMPIPRSIELLSQREWEIACLLGDGLKIDDIAEKLTISPATVKVHLRNIRHKLGCPSLPQLRALLSRLKLPPS